MKLSKYVHIVFEDKFTLLFNTINSCIVQLKPTTGGNIESLFDELSEEELCYLELNKFFISDEDALKLFFTVPRQPVLNITVALTERCNLHCRYCYQNDLISRLVMDRCTIDKIVTYISKVLSEHEYINEIHFDLIGGEPLMAMEQVRYLVNKMRNFTDVGIYYLLETNGTLFTDKAREIFDDVNLVAHITLTLPEDHNYVRPFKKEECKDDSFSVILNNLVEADSFFKKKNHQLALRYNLHKKNMDAFDDFLSMMREKLPYEFSVEVAPVIDYEYNEGCDALSTDEYSKWYLPKHFENRQGVFSCEKFLIPSTRCRQCVGYQPNNIKINPDGSLSICNAWVAGNRRGSIDMLLNGETKEGIFPECRHSQELDEECADCEFLFLCGGKRLCRGDNQCHFTDYDIDDYLVRYVAERG